MEINGVIHEHQMPHAIAPQIHIQRLYACGSPSLDDGTVARNYLLPLTVGYMTQHINVSRELRALQAALRNVLSYNSKRRRK